MDKVNQKRQALNQKLKGQAKSAKDKRNLDFSLDSLNDLIEQGIDFPDAITLILNHYDVNQYELTKAYDEQ